jgi:hypothetical protein
MEYRNFELYDSNLDLYVSKLLNDKTYYYTSFVDLKIFTGLSNFNKVLYNFRFTYFCLKFKNKFKRWLWEKVREPKIMKKFHPDHLNSLQENEDLEVFLEEWIKK